MEKLVIVIKVQAMRATFGSCRLPAALNDSQVGGGVRGVLYFDAAGRFSGNASSSHTINWSSLMMSMLWSSMSQPFVNPCNASKIMGLDAIIRIRLREPKTADFLASISKCQGLFKESVVQRS
ncbi:uncharacterized protein LOC105357979 isoform X1 [Oryzias latipes]|uniref:uncharacterized protein LOC105357979 isoform X1 n=1 Tax=Oryzias latipes TaxID=8090 RepID=UPI000CE1DABE|nr:uncharacterized protein LOC105357979 isoform X1 [Oryzias latipes]XP_023816785.1 uncharacterized protein LOC105357979 isoform X1 [Oryzias latipes]